MRITAARTKENTFFKCLDLWICSLKKVKVSENQNRRQAWLIDGSFNWRGIKIFLPINGLITFSTKGAGISDLMIAVHRDFHDVCMILKVLRSLSR